MPAVCATVQPVFMAITAAVAAVRADIALAAERVDRDPAAIRLIAVTKSQGPDVLPELAACGLHVYGENRIDHLALMAAAAPAGARFHHIGRIQSRQIPAIVAHAVAVHGLCDPDHARRLNRAAAEVGRRIEVFCQVNTSGEMSKAGIDPADVPALLAVLADCAQLDTVGLMTIAPVLDTHADAEPVRACFRRLRELAHQHGLSRLSMGMSGDLDLAIAEGATDVRIGTRLFV